MTDRYLAQDLRNDIITLLQNATTGFNALVTTINSERTHTAPAASQITYKWGQNQFPLLLVEVVSSEVQYDDPATPMSLVYKNLPEVYTIQVTGYIKSTEDSAYNWIEDWIEAVIRVLHNYNSNGISWIALTRTDRLSMYGDENKVMKSFLCEFECRVN